MPAAVRKRETPASRATAALNPDESPLAWLRRRKDKDGTALISAPQFDAGERLRADFWFGQMTPRVTMSWSAVSPGQRRRSGWRSAPTPTWPTTWRARASACAARSQPWGRSSPAFWSTSAAT